MTFMHKLSKRLALMKASFAAAAVTTLAACTLQAGRFTGPSLPSSPLVQVVTSPDTVTLDPYQTRQFLASGRTPVGDSVAVRVRWTASAGTITSGGLYTADTIPGEYFVTATTTDGSVTGSSRVKNRGPLTQVLVTPAIASVLVGGTLQFAAYGRRKNGDSVAVSVVYAATGGTVSGVGLYTAGQSAGTYRVIATQSGGTLADTVAVTIATVPVASVAVSPASASVTVGQTVQLTATPKDAGGNALSGRVVTWATSNGAIATVSASGVVTGAAAGSAMITATSEGQGGTAAITVLSAPVASVTVSPASAGVTVGGTTQLTVTLKDASGNPLTGRVVTWVSSAPTVATVTGTGLVSGVTAGSAMITATSEGQSGTAALTVTTVPVASVVVSPASASGTIGGTTQLTAALKDASGNPLTGRVGTWGSSAPTVATVSGTGLVSGVTAGSATITATSGGKSGSPGVTVTAPGSSPITDPWAVLTEPTLAKPASLAPMFPGPFNLKVTRIVGDPGTTITFSCGSWKSGSETRPHHSYDQPGSAGGAPRMRQH